MSICPCCGHSIPTDETVRIDVDGGFIVANGAVARLTEGQFNLFHMLWQNSLRMITRERLMSESYWLRSDEEEPDIKIIDVLVCKIRKKLQPLDINIDTVWGRGYRILQQQRVAA